MSEYVSWWNNKIVPMQPEVLKKVTSIVGSRERLLRERVKEDKSFRRNIERVMGMPLDAFVRGKNWLNFDWIIKDSVNYAKLIEGNYTDAVALAGLLQDNEKARKKKEQWEFEQELDRRDAERGRKSV